MWCRREDSNLHALSERLILSQLRLPFRHAGTSNNDVTQECDHGRIAILGRIERHFSRVYPLQDACASRLAQIFRAKSS